MPKTVLIL